MLLQCLINHSTIFLFNNYAIMEKEKDFNFLAKEVQKSVNVIAFAIFASCSVIAFFIMMLWNNVRYGIKKIYGQFSHSSRARNFLFQAAVGDNLPQDALIETLWSLCLSDSWKRQKLCVNSEGTRNQAKALASSDRLWNLIGDCSPTFQKEFLESALIALKPHYCLRA